MFKMQAFVLQNEVYTSAVEMWINQRQGNVRSNWHYAVLWYTRLRTRNQCYTDRTAGVDRYRVSIT